MASGCTCTFVLFHVPPVRCFGLRCGFGIMCYTCRIYALVWRRFGILDGVPELALWDVLVAISGFERPLPSPALPLRSANGCTSWSILSASAKICGGIRGNG